MDIDIDLDLYLVILIKLGEVYYSLENYKEVLKMFKTLLEHRDELNDLDIGYFDGLISFLEDEEGITLEEEDEIILEEDEGIILEGTDSPDLIIQEIKQLKLLLEDQRHYL